MKKFLILILTGFCLSAAPTYAQFDTPSPDEHLQSDKIYFFIHPMCQSCRPAYEYISKYHKDLNIPLTNMKFKHNLDLYKECVNKFNIKNSELRLPLICMGDNYIMGWENGSGILFEQYLQKFKH